MFKLISQLWHEQVTLSLLPPFQNGKFLSLFFTHLLHRNLYHINYLTEKQFFRFFCPTHFIEAFYFHSNLNSITTRINPNKDNFWMKKKKLSTIVMVSS